MTAQNDLDRTLGAWFEGDALSAPPEPLARVIESTRASDRARRSPLGLAAGGSGLPRQVDLGSALPAFGPRWSSWPSRSWPLPS